MKREWFDYSREVNVKRNKEYKRKKLVFFPFFPFAKLITRVSIGNNSRPEATFDRTIFSSLERRRDEVF